MLLVSFSSNEEFALGHIEPLSRANTLGDRNTKKT